MASRGAGPQMMSAKRNASIVLPCKLAQTGPARLGSTIIHHMTGQHDHGREFIRRLSRISVRKMLGSKANWTLTLLEQPKRVKVQSYALKARGDFVGRPEARELSPLAVAGGGDVECSCLP